MQEKHYTHLIWDFNGTILDDVDACIKSANMLLAAYDLPMLPSRAEYKRYFGFPIIDYYRRLGFDFDRLSYEKLAPEWVGYYMENVKDAPLCAGVTDAFDRAKRAGLSQWVLSATEQDMLTRQLGGLGIRDRFDGILGMDTIHAHSKEAIGVAWRASHPNATALMLGDTDHDAAVAKAMGIDCILLTTGHQARDVLEKAPCLAVVDSATEALERVLV
ncbi:MAG: HAD family hydrolase [Clostridia bacterium]|nr:HAD family hydrolase [Clostridia bacterium]